VKSSVIRTAIDHYRHTVHEREQIGYEIIMEQPELDSNIFSNLSRDQILEIINTLPNGYRMVINLYLIDGYTHAEIAEMMNISEGTSKSQLSRGRDLLKKELIKIGYEEKV
jgi:RNA polymerase sigma-70 factor (ECF subfamily)